MSRKHSKGSIPTPPPPPPIAPLKRSQTISVMDNLPPPCPPPPPIEDPKKEGSGAAASKPTLPPKPSGSRLIRALSGNSLTFKRRKSSSKKPEITEPPKRGEANNETIEPIKEETEGKPQEVDKGTKDVKEESIGSEASGTIGERSESEARGEEKRSPTVAAKLEVAAGEKDEHSLTPNQRKKLEVSLTPKKDDESSLKRKQKVKKTSKKVQEGSTKERTAMSHELREAGLWKLPGLDPISLRRCSTGGVTHEISRTLPRAPSNPPTMIPENKSGSQPDLPSLPQFRPLPEIPPDLAASLPEIPSSTQLPNTTLMTPNSTTLSRVSLTSSTEVSPMPAKEKKLSQASLSSSSQDQRFTPPQGDDTSANATTEATAPPETLSIGEMVKLYSKSFPLRIKVLQGYCSENSQVNISTNDVYKIDFVKQTKIVRIKDEDGDMFSIPLGSGMKFGPIYKPHHDFDKALTGFQFEKVSDIVAMPSLPKVVCATTAYQPGDEKLTLEENEVLVVRQVHKSMFKGRKGLKVYSLLTKSEKLLPDDCPGHFSTKPSLVRLHLPEIIEYIQNPFPMHAVMYIGLDASAQIPGLPGSHSRVVTMCESVIETSLVASFASEDDEPAEASNERNEVVGEGEGEDQHHFNITLDDEISEIEVKVIEAKAIESTEGTDDHVYDDTLALFKERNLSQFQPPEDPLNPDAKTCPQYENLTRQLPPERALPPTPPVEEDELADDDDPYATVSHMNRGRSIHDDSSEVGYVRVGSDRLQYSNPTVMSWMEDLQNSTSALEERMQLMEVTQNTTELSKMQATLELLAKKLESVDSQLHHIQSAPPPPPPPPTEGVTSEKKEGEKRSTQDENKYYLSSLSEDQVQQLLDAMDLAQYKDCFSREHITGEVLAELDEDTLKNELGMASKIHRIRLSKVISGQHSAKNYLE